ncbi:unnamed protein product [Fusarium venenatum]|uniref:Mid2 domain-containing protein n=1 Tax=Fusarium venenatum TaxID=56646 RepID=A0A2L2SV70_9HYPO|nr:uncharacterized protein FVRRES_04814 [Fusarium venenatum]KAH6991957.1 hypothetical protein EDB82DRAFT_494787 [Fusarium venenatum]CEI60378.1 unnamed protein product [Fusarium venenatum]
MNIILHFMIFFCLSIAQGYILSEPTQAAQLGEPDRPTEPPHVRRQETSTSEDADIITIAPDETCGYLSGRPGSPIICDNQETCMWMKAIGIICGKFDESDDWVVHQQCYDLEMATDPSFCDEACAADTLALHCTNASIPFCATYIFSPDGITDFRCLSTRPTRQLTASFTYIGQNDAKFITTALRPDQSYSETSPTLATPTHSSPTSSLSLPSSTSPSTSPPSSSGSTNLGAIIGGAIGGFTALSLVALATIWIMRQSRNKKNRQSMQGDFVEHDDGKPGTQVDWRSSTMTAVSWPNSALPHTGTGQPTSPSALSETSQGILTPMRPQMTHEMSGESVQPERHELGDSGIYEMGNGSNER